MFIINESECEYRFGDSGPKYFMRGPRAGIGQARLKPGEDFANHSHEVMEESFFVIKGKVEFVVDGKSYISEKGDFLSMQPNESHYLKNVGDDEAIILFCLAPFVDGDKTNRPLERID